MAASLLEGMRQQAKGSAFNARTLHIACEDVLLPYARSNKVVSER